MLIPPPSRYWTTLPNHFRRLVASNHTPWSTHSWFPWDSVLKPFLGYFTIEVQHKTEPQIIPVTFYIFEDAMGPHTLLSYPASVHLGIIIRFKVPNKVASTTVIDAITNVSKQKHIAFSSPIESDTPITRKERSQHKPKSFLKSAKPLQDHSKISPFYDPEMPKIMPF